MDNKNIKKGYLLGTFVVRDNLEKVFNLLEKGFKVEKKGVFIHETDEEDKVFITYKTHFSNEERKDFKTRMKNSL